MLSLSGTLSVSRSSGSGSELPFRSRQISAVSSRSPSRGKHNFQFGCREAHVGCSIDHAQIREKGFAVFVECVTVLRREVQE